MTRTTRGSLRLVLNAAALVVVFAALACCAVFRLGGGHWERVETPSMGTTAPVGTLLWVEPVDPADLQVGDIVSFRKPGVTDGPVFSHRIAEVHDDGTFGTAGDLSGADAWVVAPADVVGRVVHVWKGVGWLVLSAPILLLGGLLVAGLVAVVRRTAKLPVAVVGASLVIAAVLVVHQPLTGAQLLGVEQGDGAATATYVSTGLLPIDLSTSSGDSVTLSPGEDGQVTARATEDRRVEVDLQSHVPLWFWTLLIALCFSPALGSAVVGRRRDLPGRRRELAPAAG